MNTEVSSRLSNRDTFFHTSGGTYPRVDGRISPFEAYLSPEERSEFFLRDLSGRIKDTRSFVNKEYADGDIYTPPSSEGWKKITESDLFMPDYAGENVVILGQDIKFGDTHYEVTQYLKGPHERLGKLHQGWSGEETKFRFEVLVRYDYDWVFYHLPKERTTALLTADTVYNTA